jgi:predicted RNA-binding Zn-ribbon protein involved in translation (DUF1610 family)
MTSIVFCRQCGSSNVDIRGWEDENTAIFRCSDCGNESLVTGFTTGRINLMRETIADAAQDIAIYDKYNTGVKLWLDALRKAIRGNNSNG